MFGIVANLPGARETSNLLANDQIAVYPISLRGMEGNLAFSPAAKVEGMGPSYGGFFERAAFRTGLENLAYETGGEAYVGTNNFSDALLRGVSDGANYYSLADRPQNERWDGQFRKIRVSLAERGDSLAYRRGYFAYADTSPTDSVPDELAAAMRPGSPDATMLLLSSKIELPNAHHSVVRIDCTVNAAGVGAGCRPNGRPPWTPAGDADRAR